MPFNEETSHKQERSRISVRMLQTIACINQQQICRQDSGLQGPSWVLNCHGNHGYTTLCVMLICCHQSLSIQKFSFTICCLTEIAAVNPNSKGYESGLVASVFSDVDSSGNKITTFNLVKKAKVKAISFFLYGHLPITHIAQIAVASPLMLGRYSQYCVTLPAIAVSEYWSSDYLVISKLSISESNNVSQILTAFLTDLQQCIHVIVERVVCQYS